MTTRVTRSENSLVNTVRIEREEGVMPSTSEHMLQY